MLGKQNIVLNMDVLSSCVPPPLIIRLGIDLFLQRSRCWCFNTNTIALNWNVDVSSVRFQTSKASARDFIFVLQLGAWNNCAVTVECDLHT